ncbi:TetR/AcrR family transcriptional regulator [Desulfonema magnum]|uniref:Transcriptional regulator, TetR family n=1 Tax=Desulfonema magnum TaxID=45655 RepID=A0A975GTI3_9BACT|nr:TetR/AcrR family transcriptional regulator [Desulfonema magnum]QTA93150.1 Transcriptional regulator, TetR family [Desulfonema magnum]
MSKIVDKKKRRSEIAKAAVDIFARKGFENTTVQEIADRAKIAKGTVYLYFKTKEDILNEASKEILCELEGNLLHSLSRLTDPVEKLSALITEAMTITPEFEQIFIVYMESRLFHLRDREYGTFIKNFEESLRKVRRITVEIIRQGKTQGAFRNDADAEALAFCLFGAFDGVVMQYLHNKSGFDIENVRNEFLKNFFNGLMDN